MNVISSWKIAKDDFEVEYDFLNPTDMEKIDSTERRDILEALRSVDGKLEVCEQKIDELNTEIEKLTSHADGVDYIIAVGSGILAGTIDILFVDDFSLIKANEIGNEKVNDYVLKTAQKRAEKQGKKINNLADAVDFLEDEYPIVADKATNVFGGGTQHHLRDFSHHPTPVGLFFSMLTQFTKKVYGTDVTGAFFVGNLQEKDMVFIGNNLPEKIMFGAINWFFHMVSDMAGSSGTVRDGKTGTGLPGPIVSLLKEMSALPFFQETNENGHKKTSVWISKLFNGTLLGEHDENGKIIKPLKFDLRTEIGIATQIKQQAIPVIINECIVRSFYFIRRFYMELKNNEVETIEDLKKIKWSNVLPFNNRTIAKMLTISTGTLTAIDVADAAIEAAIKSGGVQSPMFIRNMIVKVNFVGIGRFAIAVGTDVKMGIDRSQLQNERISLRAEQINLLNARVYYKCADLFLHQEEVFEKQEEMWISAKDTVQTLQEAQEYMEESLVVIGELLEDTYDSLQRSSEYIDKLEQYNPGLKKDVISILRYGRK